MLDLSKKVEGFTKSVTEKGVYECRFIKMIIHKPEEMSNKADCMMFKSINNEIIFLTCKSQEQAEQHLNNIAKQLELSDVSLAEIVEEMKSDVLIKIWANPVVKPTGTYLNFSAYEPFGFNDDDME